MNGIAEGRMMKDSIEQIGKSVIQHGKFNDRIYLLKLAPDDCAEIIPHLEKLAAREGYTKIFAKIRTGALPGFLLEGYSIEGYVPEYYNGTDDCLMVSKFRDEKRSRPPLEALQRFYSLLASAGDSNNDAHPPGNGFHQRELGPEDAGSITEVFKQVFETYPFPVHDPGYILQTMKDKSARYFGIWDGDNLAGVSTAETDLENMNAEMTDFAVLPRYRGQKLALRLLEFMEREMKASGIKTAYTIARLEELGMNKTFLNLGYKYTGTLVNNTNIGGSIESMNIFYKKL